MIDAHKQAFKEEATELLVELENTLLELEESPDNAELIAKTFRALHTIKGSSGMFGFDDITMFTHDIESVYDLIRNNKIRITKEIIDLTLLARDSISLMLKNSDGGNDVDAAKTNEILHGFRNIIAKYQQSKNEEVKETPKTNEIISSSVKSKLSTYQILFSPNQDIFLSGSNPLFLINELKELGSSIISCDSSKIPTLENMNPEFCYFNWEILLLTDKGIDSIKDVFIFIEDQCELKIKTVDESEKYFDEESFRELQSIYNGKAGDANFNFDTMVNDYLSVCVEAVEGSKSEIRTKRSKEIQSAAHEQDAASSIRVHSDKLDELVNLVGELVTVQARLSQIATVRNDIDIDSVSEEVERITWSLRDSALNIRMLPIGTTFSKFKRLVRDLSNELGKEIEFTTDGAETELDKTVIEKLSDPLVHIIRNCIDHGIEKPEVREKAGKNRSGWVQVSAKQSGGNVLIEICDDGAGLDKDAIRAKAINQGLANENAELSDSEIFSMIFLPGFSTAKKVTNVSGRGVGMDVVKKAIDSLRGTVEVRSEKGNGTTITLKLPLTLAIIDGLLVKIEDDHYILPLSSVEECLELSKEDIDKAHGRHIVNVRGSIVPYISLRERFGIKMNRPELEQIVVASINGHSVGFVVDQVFGQHQTVLKSLGKYYKNVEGVSGATVMGDGTVALILDINKLYENEELQDISFNNELSKNRK